MEFVEGDSVALALLRSGIHPRGGGCICLQGDCPNCLVSADGVAYVRSCQLRAEDGLEVGSQLAAPTLPTEATRASVRFQSLIADLVVVGQSEHSPAAAGSDSMTFDARRGEEVLGVYSGPTVVARTREGMVSVRCSRVVIATGAAEIQPICPGSHLEGIVTKRAATVLSDAGVDLGDVVTVTEHPVRFEGSRRVEAVVLADGTIKAATTVVVDLGSHPRDGLVRMGIGLEVAAAGSTEHEGDIPPPPTAGVVCPCSDVTVDDLKSAWSQGFREMELLKRATLAGTGTCQGMVCTPHLRAFLTARGARSPAPFTARPLSRQATMAEVAAGFDLPPFRRTALHGEHLRLGATMDRFGGWWRPWRYPDRDAEYWAVRERVSLGDVSTLGKMEIAGPDVVEFLERVYPCRVSDLRPGQVRYALLLDERGSVLDDGLICRLGAQRFFLTFTSGGASFAEMWLRDWAETYGADVRILDRTMSLGAINVTGPRAASLLRAGGLEGPPAYMTHVDTAVFGVECRVVRLSFTGEASFELHHDWARSVELWQSLEAAGEGFGIYPHGLDVLFTLRLEKGHFIVGMDSEYDSTPRRLGLEWAARLSKPDFIGRQALLRTNRLPLNKRLLGWEMDGQAPTEGAILWQDRAPIGQVTSARFSPVLDRTVMLGWYRGGAEPPAGVTCDGRPVRPTSPPFYDPDGSRARG